MSDEKKLHWFKFSPQDWQNGDITLESYEVQGVFINVCAYYFIKECSITLALLKKRFKGSSDAIDKMVDLGIIDHCNETDFITINFLNRQFDELSNARKLRQEAGRKGGLSNAKGKLKQCSSDTQALRIEENRVEHNRTETKEKFISYMKLYEGSKGKSYDMLFEEFIKSCKKIKAPIDVELEKIPAAIKAYTDSVNSQRRNGFKDLKFKNASTWINNQCWREEHEEKKKEIIEC